MNIYEKKLPIPYIYKLYKLVFNNLIIRKIIFKYLKIFNIYYCSRVFNSLKDLLEFKYINYLYQIELKNYKIEDGDLELLLPPNIEKINYNKNFMSIPSTIKSISIDSKLPTVGESINVSILPDSIQEVSLHGYLWKLNRETMPINLKKLKLCNMSSTLLRDVRIDKFVLPTTLEELLLERTDFIIPLEKDYLPIGLKKLSIIYTNGDNGYSISSNKDLSFLQSLEYFEIIIKEFGFILPNSLKELRIITSSIGYGVYKYFEFAEALERLSIECFDNIQPPIDLTILNKFSNSLKFFEIQRCTTLLNSKGLSIINSNLESLIIKNEFNQRLVSHKHFPIESNLKYLKLGNQFNNSGFPLIDSDLFPDSLIHLDLGNKFNQPIGTNVLPSKNLKYLIIGSGFNQKIQDFVLPMSLEILDLSNNLNSFNININNSDTIVKYKFYSKQFDSCPDLLKALDLTHYTNQPLRIKKYKNLKYLKLYNGFNQTITTVDLPSPNNIKTLVIGTHFNQDINLEHFNNLETITIDSNNFNNYSYIPKISTTIYSSQPYFYNLKSIEIKFNNTSLLDSINPIFYEFVILKKK